MRRKKTNKASLARTAMAAAAGFLFCGACGDEEPVARRSSWREVAVFPYEAGHVRSGAVTGDGAFYAASAYSEGSFSDSYGVVYRSYGGALEEVFRSPYAGSCLGVIGAGGGAVWAAGFKKVEREPRPYVVRYLDGRWEEVAVPPEVGGLAFSDVYPRGRDFCWFKGTDGIYTYDDGAWRLVLDCDKGYAACFSVTAAGRAFLVPAGSKHNPPGAPAIKLFVNDDCGDTWHEEKIMPPDLARPFFTASALVRAGGEQVFVETLLSVPRYLRTERRYYTAAIYARDGAPAGRGSYHIVFESAKGDYFENIWAMAFRSREEGYAVGPYTSVALDDGEWYVEAWDKSLSPYFEGIAAGPSGYWAIGMPAYQQPRRLYHAP